MESTVTRAFTTDGHRAEICTITHDGHSYTAMGAVLDPERPTCYTDGNGNLTTWQGEIIGSYRVTNTFWHNFGGKMECIEGCIAGRYYYGRKSADWSQLISLRPYKTA
jgi:hypothetical protein